MRTTTERHGTDAPEGYWWVATPETDPDWRFDSGHRCRADASRYKKACGRPSVAALYRRRWSGGGAWWAYCEQHLYGRWIEDGQLWKWVLRPIEEDDG